MSFLGNILNGIPVVGHVKGILHYATGDHRAGDRAMMAATRTSAVMAGGAVGVLGGPAGVVAGATSAGFLMDSATSIATGRPQGIIQSVDDIVTDIGNGEVPVRSVLKTGIYVGADALSGFGGGSIASNVGGTMGKSMAKDAAVIVARNASACQMAAVGSLGRSVAEEAPQSQPRSFSGSSSNKPNNEPPPSTTTTTNNSRPSQSTSNSGERKSKPPPSTTTTTNNSRPPQSTSNSGERKSNKSSSTGSGSGSQPPRKPNNNNMDNGKDTLYQRTHLEVFLSLFDVDSLDDVVICGNYLFRNLLPGQVKTLKKLIKQLRLNGTLKRVVKTVSNLMYRVAIEDITFQNFLSLTQFVSAYLAEQAARKCEAERGNATFPLYKIFQVFFEERREEYLLEAATTRTGYNPSILMTFMSLYDEISSFSCDPGFRNIYSAIYHYYKHKLVPQTDRVLSVSNYYCLIQKLLERVKSLLEYSQLIDPNHSRRELVFDRIFNVFGRLVRVRIVTKVQDGNLELSSCYILDDDEEYDEEGEEFIDPQKDRG